MFASRGFRLASLLACVVMAFSMISIDQAEARRGGSFGSRGTRTFQSAPATHTSPNVTAPVQRSMTPGQQNNTAPRTGAQGQQRNPLGGFGGPLLSGLMFGGLLGMMFGHGFGGMAGLFGLLVQVVLAAFVIRFLMRAFSGSTARSAMAGGGGSGGYTDQPQGNRSGLGSGMGQRSAPRNPDELGIKPADLDRFEAMLSEVQSAFDREDYATLRELTTPEMMSYLSEELGENASRGLKNEVSQIKLVSGDVAESWREGNLDYATAALRYAAVDVTRERASGRIVEGDENEPSETTELWTFVRRDRGDWKLSAIQQA
jgi:predicted lipid-binding transport protein (Tim44 family)